MGRDPDDYPHVNRKRPFEIDETWPGEYRDLDREEAIASRLPTKTADLEKMIAPRQEAEPSEDLSIRVKQLEAVTQDLLRKVRALEAQLGLGKDG